MIPQKIYKAKCAIDRAASELNEIGATTTALVLMRESDRLKEMIDTIEEAIRQEIVGE